MDSIKIKLWNIDLAIQTQLSMKFHWVSKIFTQNEVLEIGGIYNPQK